MSERIERIENEYSLQKAGQPAVFYLSSGPYDDYLELVLPPSASLTDHQRARLEAISSHSDAGSVDIWIRAEPQPIVSVTCLYVGCKADRSNSYVKRLHGVISRIAAALPDADFGPLAASLGPFDLSSLSATSAEPAQPAPAAPVAASDGSAQKQSTDLRADPEPVADTRPLIASLLQQADQRATRGQSYKALRLVDEALRLSPNHLLAMEYRAKLTLLVRRIKRQERQRTNAQAHLEAGFSYLVTGCDALAIAAFRQSISLKPGAFLAQLLLGVAYHHQGRLADARMAYEAAQRLQPANPAPRDLIEALVRGEAPPLPVEDEVPVRPQPVPHYHQRWANAG